MHLCVVGIIKQMYDYYNISMKHKLLSTNIITLDMIILQTLIKTISKETKAKNGIFWHAVLNEMIDSRLAVVTSRYDGTRVPFVSWHQVLKRWTHIKQNSIGVSIKPLYIKSELRIGWKSKLK